MKQVKTIIATVMLAAFFAGPVLSQDKKETKKETPLKEHKCTAECHKNGKGHVYAHGEKGHTCGAECKKMMEKGKM